MKICNYTKNHVFLKIIIKVFLQDLCDPYQLYFKTLCDQLRCLVEKCRRKLTGKSINCFTWLLDNQSTPSDIM